jgi:cobalt-precorrin 5A hydrolase
MIVAGLGSRRGVGGNDVLAAIDAALGRAQLDRAQLDLLATVPLKRNEPGIRDAARLLGLPLIIPEKDELEAATLRIATRSEASLENTGLPSAAEASALAAAGPASRLILPRLALGPVTCALAEANP